ncbi:MAG: hypothetical protein AAGI10_00570 [Pseudomonadota bacterium]
MRRLFFVVFTAFCFAATVAHATPLDRWSTSCSVDRGSITKRSGTYTFKTSTNRCPGGVFNQRAEIKTEKVRPNIQGAYLFETNVAMTSNANEQFDIFQMHDGRDGCAPPLKVQVAPNNSFRIQSAVKLGPGENCLPEDRITGNANVKLRRDGTEHNLRILIQFDGQAGFRTTVWLDGVVAVQGRYTPSDISGAFRSKNFYFKHGVYSQRMFEYTMTSRDMGVRKVKVSN